MKYTKDNIEGIVFKSGSGYYMISNSHLSWCTLRKVKDDDDPEADLWVDNNWSRLDIVDCLNGGSYIPVTLEPNYEIY